LKSHLLREDGKKTLCGVKATDFTPMANNAADATCKRCVQKVATETLAQGASLELMGFSEMEVMFAAHPLVVTNGARAAREVGYSENVATRSIGALRRKLWPLIQHFQQQRAERFSISRERIQHELATVGFANILDYVEIDEETGETRTKMLNELTRDQAAAIQEYSLMPVEKVDPETGETKVVKVLSKIRLFDKRSALVDLGKTIGMFNEKMQVTLSGDTEEERAEVPLNKLSTSALEQIQKIIIRAASEVESAQADTKALPGQCVTVSDDGKK
jgi:phage terminase small subunit